MHANLWQSHAPHGPELEAHSVDNKESASFVWIFGRSETANCCSDAILCVISDRANLACSAGGRKEAGSSSRLFPPLGSPHSRSH